MNIPVFLRIGLIKGTSFLLFFILPFIALAQPANNSSCSPTTLNSGVACANTAGALRNAGGSATAFAGVNAFCGNAASPDVWYTFQAQSTNPTIALSGMGNQMRLTPRLALYDFNGGACNDLTVINNGALTCVSGTNTPTLSLNATGLTIGDTYHIRIFTNGTSVAAGVPADWNFNICITDPWVNNNTCGTSTLLTSSTSCASISGTMIGATNSGGFPTGCGHNSSPDVWYTFVAQSFFPTISLSNIGSTFATAQPRIQILTGAACGSATQVGLCGSANSLRPTVALTIGNTYRIRIATAGSAAIATNGGFSICVVDPAPAVIDYGKSYVNITKGAAGGTVNPGDTLEIRSTFVVDRNNGVHKGVDNISFSDTLFRNRGLVLVPGTIQLRTNEGILFGSVYSDNLDADAGHRTQIAGPQDTAIRINMGAGATAGAGGFLSSESMPRFYDQTCIVMATYRVRVYAGYGTRINFGGGAFRYRDTATGISSVLTLPTDSLVVYSNPGLCTDAVSVSNAVGVVSNGTFGAGTTQNLPASPYVPGYIYEDFDAAGGPNDYYYGIANNTSATFTTSTTAPKPDLALGQRVHTLWDITGDHTGAVNQARGNPPCNTSLPISASNPCGYMLVINSSYKTDVAFNYSVSNLCPNTYYEVSAWLKNMCSKCGCDVDGDGATNGGASYNPTVIGDSSGVKPNLAYKINGIDYYTTGNISYTGTASGGRDSNNVWVKKGFTYLTGPGETSFNLTIRNNAPGGGGNDWALDDISVRTCLPEMVYSPSNNPTICAGTYLTIRDNVTSFFNNYTYYKWQRSTTSGASWTDVTGPLGPVPPGVSNPNLHNNGSEWEYAVYYTIPPANTNVANSGDRYRLITATSMANLGNSNCEITDGTSEVAMNIINCGVVLTTNFISLNGKLVNSLAHLSWTASTEDKDIKYQIERSTDGNNFIQAGIVDGYNNNNSVNQYSFIDPVAVTGKIFYRIVMTGTNNNKKYSRTILLTQQASNLFELSNLVNPFNQKLEFDIIAPSTIKAEAELIDMFGKVIRKKTSMLQTGVNRLSFTDTEPLPAGTYILRIRNNDQIITKKVLKRSNL